MCGVNLNTKKNTHSVIYSLLIDLEINQNSVLNFQPCMSVELTVQQSEHSFTNQNAEFDDFEHIAKASSLQARRICTFVLYIEQNF